MLTTLASLLLAASAAAGAQTAAFSDGRIDPDLARLPDGRILLMGGYDTRQEGVPGTEIYDPRSGSWSSGQADRLPCYIERVASDQGRIIVIGGREKPRGSSLSGVHIYDPRKGGWRRGADMPTPRDAYGMARLPDGRWLVVGGYKAVDGRGAAVDAAEIYDPTKDEWSQIEPIPVPGWLPYVESLPGGRVLVAGGSHIRVNPQAYLYDPVEGGWRATSPMLYRHESGESLALPDGRVLVAGGYDNGVFTPYAEAFDPRSGRWSPAGRLETPRMGTALALVGGRAVLIGGGNHDTNALSSTEIFDPETSSWRPGPRLRTARNNPEAIALDSSRVLVVGGSRDGRHALNDSEIIDIGPPSVPDEAIAAREPLERRAPVRKDDYALVIGVQDYRDLPDAAFAERDAAGFAAAFESLGVPPENVVTLTGGRASLSALTKYVEEWLPRRAVKGSRVYFFFSGHGAPDVKNGDAYLMPWDGDAAFVRSTGFPLQRLYAALGSLRADQVIVMLDSCFAGTGARSVLPEGLRPLVPARLPQAVPSRLTVLTASEKEEAAGSIPERSHGLFSYYMLRGLAGEANPGAEHVTLEQLHAYVRKRVVLDARRQDREQTPTLTTTEPALRLY